MDLNVGKFSDKGPLAVESVKRRQPPSRKELCNACKTIRISQLEHIPWPGEHRHAACYADLVTSADSCPMCRLMVIGLRRSYAWRKSNFEDPLILDHDLLSSPTTKDRVLLYSTQVGLQRLPFQRMSVRIAHVSYNRAVCDFDLYAFPGMYDPPRD